LTWASSVSASVDSTCGAAVENSDDGVDDDDGVSLAFSTVAMTLLVCPVTNAGLATVADDEGAAPKACCGARWKEGAVKDCTC